MIIGHSIVSLNTGGIETWLRNMAIENEKNGSLFFLFFVSSDVKGYYHDEIDCLKRSKVILVGKKKTNLFKHYSFIKNYKVDIIHLHDRDFSVLEMFFLKLNGFSGKFIYHSHNVKSPNSIIRKIAKPFLSVLMKLSSSKNLACSINAGKALFGKSRFTIIHYGVNKEYYSNLKYRGSQKTLRLIHVGRYMDVKNHIFLIELSKLLREKKIDFQIDCYGHGPLKNKLNIIINNEDLSDFIKLHTPVNNIYEKLDNCDIFLFPSKFEGLGIVILEAQAAGLKVVISENVPEEVIYVKESVSIINISEIHEWVRQILIFSKSRNEKKSISLSYFNNDGATTEKAYKMLKNIYFNI